MATGHPNPTEQHQMGKINAGIAPPVLNGQDGLLLYFLNEALQYTQRNQPI
jgi:hypothetical protein